jgi:hypothetical protein
MGSMAALLTHHFYKLGTLQVLGGESTDYIVAEKRYIRTNNSYWT